MSNPFIKQFPDLLKGKKLMYVHGFGSSAQSGTVDRMRAMLPSATVIARDMPIHPAEAIALLHDLCATEQPDLIIGTSMGGMFTEMLYGYDRILVNPAFEMGDTMREHGMTGKQVYQNPRMDGVQEFIVTKSLVKEYKQITEQCFKGITAEEQQRVYGLFGDEDDVVDTLPLFSRHYTHAIAFHGGHRLNDSSFLHGVIPVIRWIDDRQERRRRPVILIHLSAMTDKNGQPASSMYKAYNRLIEVYDVHIVADAPTNRPEYLQEAQAWVKEHISTPAHDHVLFANNTSLLYADYLIDTRENSDFAGTNIVFGSSEFKTWEEIIVFFDRLGGQ